MKLEEYRNELREDIREVKTDVKHILKHLEKQNGRIGMLESALHNVEKEQVQIKTSWSSAVAFFSIGISTLINWIIRKVV